MSAAQRTLERSSEAVASATSKVYGAMGKAKTEPLKFAAAKDKLTAAVERNRVAEANLANIQSSMQSGASSLAGRAGLEQKLATAMGQRQSASEKLAAATQRNSKIDSARSMLNSKGIKIDGGGLKLPSLKGLQERLVQSKASLTELTSGFRVFGMSLGTAAGAMAGVALAGVAAAAGLLMLAMSRAKAMDVLQEEAMAIGMSVEGLQRLNHTYHELGVGQGVMAAGSQRLQVTIENAMSGNEDARESFERLGISMDELGRMTPEQAFERTMGAIRNLESHGAKIKVLKDLMGRGGMGLAGAVNAPSEELAEASERAKKLVLPTSMVMQMSKVSDAVEASKSAFGNLMTMMSAEMMPILKSMADSVWEFATTDLETMKGGFQAIALGVAVVYDIVALLVGQVRMVFNIVQALLGIIASGIVYALGAVAKVVQWLVYGVEWLLGSSHGISDSIGDAASAAFGVAKELAVGAGDDIGEAMKQGMDSINPDASIAVVQSIMKSWDKTAEAIKETNPVIKPTLSDSAIKAISKTLNDLEKKAQELRVGESQSVIDELKKQGADESQIARAQALQKEIVMLEQQKDITEQIAKARLGVAEASMSEKDFTLKVAMDNGANNEQANLLVELKNIEAMKKKMRDDEAAAATANLNTIKDLKDQVAQIGLTEAQILDLKLAQTNATSEQRDEAQKLQEILNNAKIGKDMESHFARLDERLLEAQGAEEELIKRQLQNIGLTGQALDDAVTKTLEMEAQIAAAEKAKSDAASVTSTLEGLEKEFRQLNMTEAQKLAEDLKAQGASAEQIARASELQTAISESADTKSGGEGLITSLDTALGAMKIAGSGVGVAERTLSAAEKQVDLLQTVAENTMAMANLDSAVDGKSAMPIDQELSAATSGASRSTLPNVDGINRSEDDLAPLVRESNAFLSEISKNTKAFAGVLT